MVVDIVEMLKEGWDEYERSRLRYYRMMILEDMPWWTL